MGVVFTTANRHGLVEIRAADVAGAVRLCLWRNLGVTWSASDDRRHVARIRVRIVCDQAGVDDVRPCGPTPSFRLLRGLVATFSTQRWLTRGSGCAVPIYISGLVVRVGCVRPVWRRAQRVEALVNVDMAADKQVLQVMLFGLAGRTQQQIEKASLFYRRLPCARRHRSWRSYTQAAYTTLCGRSQPATEPTQVLISLSFGCMT